MKSNNTSLTYDNVHVYEVKSSQIFVTALKYILKSRFYKCILLALRWCCTRKLKGNDVAACIWNTDAVEQKVC